MKRKQIHAAGFTLIETIIYIALFGFIMTGVIVGAYDLISSTQGSAGKTTVQEEGTFVGRKFEWALSDMSGASIVGGNGCAQTLSITKTGYPRNPIEFQRNTLSNTIEIREGSSGGYTPITTNNVVASCLTFTPIAASGSGPAGITITLTINGLDFVNTKYVRK